VTDAPADKKEARLCCQCGKHCISWCYYCKKPFCGSGPCIEAHDGKCPGYHDARAYKPKPEEPVKPVVKKPLRKKGNAR
jgi:hypothetical protein